MHPRYHIHQCSRKDLSADKWDACIERSPMGLIYGRSYYLDHMADGQWDALVLGDYEAVMPLPWRKKWGIRYLYQPAFTQQLGIFSPDPVSTTLIDAFLDEMHQRFSFAEIFLNYGNVHPNLQPYTNFILDLGRPYGKLAANYRTDLVNNLKKASRRPFQYTEDLDLAETLSLFKQQYSLRLPHIKEATYTHFQHLCQHLREKGQLLLRGITNAQRQLLATALLPRDKNRLYLLQSTTMPGGRQEGANHFLLDRLIHEFAGQDLTLDFEGSEIPGIAHFYENFGSHNQPYHFHRYNMLSWPLRIFK